ncbi:hypothetical protein NQ176_g4834 [Zarea fungicola]|uniref:Uncharacterized protein n=1 Tax=Zarea fungicola TaxID=93591 RepID=A0ACC1NC44_9HYPO|nr:hypothetical protein NQ176_g4834 [Lecanicillium fungicola]
MKFAPFVVTASMAAGSDASPMSRRELGGILLCTGVNATGTCIYNTYNLEECHQLRAPFLANTSTFAPDGENFACYPRNYNCGEPCMSPTGCTFGQVDFDYIHKYDLGAIGWANLMHSFDCFKKKSN